MQTAEVKAPGDQFSVGWISMKGLAERKAQATAEAQSDWRLGRLAKWTRATWREAADPERAREYSTAYEREARGKVYRSIKRRTG